MLTTLAFVVQWRFGEVIRFFRLGDWTAPRPGQENGRTARSDSLPLLLARLGENFTLLVFFVDTVTKCPNLDELSRRQRNLANCTDPGKKFDGNSHGRRLPERTDLSRN